MRIDSRGRVTIPAPLRAKHGLREGDEVDVVEQDEALCIVRVGSVPTAGPWT